MCARVVAGGAFCTRLGKSELSVLFDRAGHISLCKVRVSEVPFRVLLVHNRHEQLLFVDLLVVRRQVNVASQQTVDGHFVELPVPDKRRLVDALEKQRGGVSTTA
jgi:hypothetical protein